MNPSLGIALAGAIRLKSKRPPMTPFLSPFGTEFAVVMTASKLPVSLWVMMSVASALALAVVLRAGTKE